MKVTGFDESIHAEMLISQALSSNRFPHSVIIEGGTPEERLNLANKIAEALVCSDENTIPCGECHHCIKASKGMHPDIAIYNPRTEKGHKEANFSVDYVREIREKAFIIPNEANRKITILAEAQKMNEQGQNAFLKMLEEPPKFANFILLTTTRNVFIDTILSRVVTWSIGESVESEKDEIPREKLVETASAIAVAITASNDFEIIKAAGVFDKDQKLLKATLPVLEEIFGAALTIKFGAENKSEFSCATKLAQKLTQNSLLKLIDCVGELNKALALHANLNLTIARLCSLFRAAVTE